MRNNGFISAEVKTGHPDSVVLLGEQESTQFPYTQYIYTNAQTYGIFKFVFEGRDLDSAKTHVVRRNKFTHNYCMKGCAYTAMGSSV